MKTCDYSRGGDHCLHLVISGVSVPADGQDPLGWMQDFMRLVGPLMTSFGGIPASARIDDYDYAADGTVTLTARIEAKTSRSDMSHADAMKLQMPALLASLGMTGTDQDVGKQFKTGRVRIDDIYATLKAAGGKPPAPPPGYKSPDGKPPGPPAPKPPKVRPGQYATEDT